MWGESTMRHPGSHSGGEVADCGWQWQAMLSFRCSLFIWGLQEKIVVMQILLFISICLPVCWSVCVLTHNPQTFIFNMIQWCINPVHSFFYIVNIKSLVCLIRSSFLLSYKHWTAMLSSVTKSNVARENDLSTLNSLLTLNYWCFFFCKWFLQLNEKNMFNTDCHLDWWTIARQTIQTCLV